MPNETPAGGAGNVDFYRKRARKRLIGLVAVLIVAGGLFWYVVHSAPLQRISALETNAERIAAQKIASTFSAPPPLVATGTPAGTGAGHPVTHASGAATTTSSFALTSEGVIADTNVARSENGGLPPLAENQTLDTIAMLRLNDMFANQYFAHFSPTTSSSAETVAEQVGYSYISLGENLALGDFNGDTGVVTAWMNSPGHRANILDTHYTQIGVAVKEGEFQGSEVWIAVQVFGRPSADCALPDQSLKASIDASESQTSSTLAELTAEKIQLDAAAAQGDANGAAYEQQVQAYNALVDQYNAAVAQTKIQIEQYNTEVTAYNGCAGG
jgi:uncharacterized protein YkwD